MIDGITLRIRNVDRKFIIKKVFGWDPSRDKYPSKKIKYDNYYGLKIELYFDEMIVSGSLHKFFHTHNSNDFTRAQVNLAVKKICRTFGIESDSDDLDITSIEFGVNVLVTEETEKYFNMMISYKNKKYLDFHPLKRKIYIPGRKFRLSTMDIKIYDKSYLSVNKGQWMVREAMKSIIGDQKILRFELSYFSLPSWMVGEKLDYLGTRPCWNNMANELFKVYKNIIKKEPCIVDGLTPLKLRRYHLLGNTDFLKDYNFLFPKEYKQETKELRMVKKSMKKRELGLATQLEELIYRKIFSDLYNRHPLL